jgi:hypothetical protein
LGNAACGAHAPVVAYIIDQRLLIGETVAQRIASEQQNLTPSRLMVCAWQSGRCDEVQFDRGETMQEVIQDMANWPAAEQPPRLDRLQGRLQQIRQSFDDYWKARGNLAVADEDRRLLVIYLTNGDIAVNVRGVRLRAYFPTDGCIGNMAQDTMLQAVPAPREARVEVRVELPTEVQPLPPQAQRVLALLTGYGREGGGVVGYFGQSRLDCRVSNDTPIALNPFLPTPGCQEELEDKPPDHLECSKQANLISLPPPGSGATGPSPSVGPPPAGASPPGIQPAPAPVRQSNVNPGGTTTGGTSVANVPNPAGVSGSSTSGGSQPNRAESATRVGTPGSTNPLPTSPPRAPNDGPATSHGQMAEDTAQQPQPLPPSSTSLPPGQAQSTPPVPPIVKPPPWQTVPLPVLAAFTGARVISAEQPGTGGETVIGWHAVLSGASAGEVRLEVAALASDGTAGPTIPTQPIGGSKLGIPPTTLAGRYRVLAILPRPSGEAGNDCPGRAVRITLSLSGPRLDAPVEVRVEGTVQGCAGDPPSLLALDDFAVR